MNDLSTTISYTPYTAIPHGELCTLMIADFALSGMVSPVEINKAAISLLYSFRAKKTGFLVSSRQPMAAWCIGQSDPGLTEGNYLKATTLPIESSGYQIAGHVLRLQGHSVGDEVLVSFSINGKYGTVQFYKATDRHIIMWSPGLATISTLLIGHFNGQDVEDLLHYEVYE